MVVLGETNIFLGGTRYIVWKPLFKRGWNGFWQHPGTFDIWNSYAEVPLLKHSSFLSHINYCLLLSIVSRSIVRYYLSHNAVCMLESEYILC